VGGTVAWIARLLSTVKLTAAAWSNVTFRAPKKFVPVMITFVPARPFVGEKPLITGGTKKFVEATKELVEDELVPRGEATVIGPETAPVGT